MTTDDLKAALLSLGWRTSRPIIYSGVDWYAWMPSDQLPEWPDCTSNEKPPSFFIDPYQCICSKGDEFRSVEFRLCGEVPGGHWLDLKLYSVPMEDCIKTIPAAIGILGAAWERAHEYAGESTDLSEDV